MGGLLENKTERSSDLLLVFFFSVFFLGVYIKLSRVPSKTVEDTSEQFSTGALGRNLEGAQFRNPDRSSVLSQFFAIRHSFYE